MCRGLRRKKYRFQVFSQPGFTRSGGSTEGVVIRQGRPQQLGHHSSILPFCYHSYTCGASIELQRVHDRWVVNYIINKNWRLLNKTKVLDFWDLFIYCAEASIFMLRKTHREYKTDDVILLHWYRPTYLINCFLRTNMSTLLLPGV